MFDEILQTMGKNQYCTKRSLQNYVRALALAGERMQNVSVSIKTRQFDGPRKR